MARDADQARRKIEVERLHALVLDGDLGVQFFGNERGQRRQRQRGVAQRGLEDAGGVAVDLAGRRQQLDFHGWTLSFRFRHERRQVVTRSSTLCYTAVRRRKKPSRNRSQEQTAQTGDDADPHRRSLDGHTEDGVVEHVGRTVKIGDQPFAVLFDERGAPARRHDQFARRSARIFPWTNHRQRRSCRRRTDASVPRLRDWFRSARLSDSVP